jgi:hypothetical protein
MLDVAIMVEGQSGLTWPRWQRLVEAVEDLGFAALYRSDHLIGAQPPNEACLELWTSLTWLASHTRRIELGPLVSPLTFRHPVHLAHTALALDELSSGRFTLGLGAGWFWRARHVRLRDVLASANRGHPGTWRRSADCAAQRSPAHGRPELVHVNVTVNLTAARVWRQLIEATPWGQKPRHLLRDRDAVYGGDFRKRARRIGIDAIATPIHPKANAIAERVLGTLRRECLDHLILLDEQHLRSVLTEFVRYYNQERPHRTLGLQTPQSTVRPTTGTVRSRPVLNGLHHVYERAA